ncbi:MAG: HEAT repeat domain-containing protein [Caldilineaceae bacterium SB0666_bin_21]|nr:HEAT repeat domain-containing protein [Caldilineaceae bacterium SB0666_bin_21]
MAGSIYTVQELMYALVTELEYPTWEELHCLDDLRADEQAELLEFWSLVPQARRLRVAIACQELAQDHLAFRGGALFRCLANDADPQVRTAAMVGLGLDPDLASLEVLLARAEVEIDDWVRLAAAETLGRFLLAGELKSWPKGMQTAAVARLMDWSAEDASELVAVTLANLGFCGLEEVRATLAANLLSDWEVRREAALVGIANSTDRSWEPVVLGIWREDPDLDVRAAALRAAGRLGLQGFLDICLNVVEFEEEPKLRLGAIAALGDLGGAVAWRALAYASESTDEEQRLAAEKALERLESDTDPSGSIFS